MNVGLLGIEPSLSVPKTDVLPVYDSPRLRYLNTREKKILAEIYYEK